MLNQVQLMSLHSEQDLQLTKVEDLKKAIQQWLWSPLGLEHSTNEFVVTLSTDKSLDPRWHGRKMLLHFQDSWREVLNKWQIPDSITSLFLEVWDKTDTTFLPRQPNGQAIIDGDARCPAARLRDIQTQSRLSHEAARR